MCRLAWRAFGFGFHWRSNHPALPISTLRVKGFPYQELLTVSSLLQVDIGNEVSDIEGSSICTECRWRGMCYYLIMYSNFNACYLSALSRYHDFAGQLDNLKFCISRLFLSDLRYECHGSIIQSQFRTCEWHHDLEPPLEGSSKILKSLCSTLACIISELLELAHHAGSHTSEMAPFLSLIYGNAPCPMH